MKNTRVVHCKREPYDVYIGRPTKWGNPFYIINGDREECLRLYKEWIVTQVELLDSLDELEGKILGCWCKPSEGFKGRLLCHGQILIELIERK